MAKYWIAGAIRHKGALRRTARVKKGRKISTATLNRLAKRKGVTGKRARLAKTLRTFAKGRSMHHSPKVYRYYERLKSA